MHAEFYSKMKVYVISAYDCTKLHKYTIHITSKLITQKPLTGWGVSFFSDIYNTHDFFLFKSVRWFVNADPRLPSGVAKGIAITLKNTPWKHPVLIGVARLNYDIRRVSFDLRLLS